MTVILKRDCLEGRLVVKPNININKSIISMVFPNQTLVSHPFKVGCFRQGCRCVVCKSGTKETLDTRSYYLPEVLVEGVWLNSKIEYYRDLLGQFTCSQRLACTEISHILECSAGEFQSNAALVN